MFKRNGKPGLIGILSLAALLIAVPLQSAAAITEDAKLQSAQYLVKINLLKGRIDGDLALHDRITRAEFVTFIVSAFGKTGDAVEAKGANAFPDSANHWASGYIAVGKRMMEANGEIVGKPDGSFTPDGNVTVAEAIAFLMKFLGVKAAPEQSWPANYINGAISAGLLSDEDKQTVDELKNTSISRGTAFYLLDQAFRSYKTEDGKNFYEQYVLKEEVIPQPPDPNLPFTAAPDASDIHVWNYYARTDEVRVPVKAAGSVVKVYADEDGKQLLGSVTHRAGTGSTAVVKIERGLTSGNIYVSVTEPNKNESAKTVKAVGAHPQPPAVIDISNSHYSMFVKNTPTTGYVHIYDSMDASDYVGRGDNTDKNAAGETTAFLFDGSAFTLKSEWYVAFYVGGAESERIKYPIAE